MWLVGLLATGIGLTLGLLGGGGSILAVPVLTYGASLPPKEAIATSLIVVGATALFALIPHARRGNVAWRTGAVFTVTAMLGAYLGGLAARGFSGETLLLMFAAMMVVTALAMLRGPKDIAPSGSGGASRRAIVAEGLAVGAATGLVGAGGGFLVVPALVLLGGMPMHRAIGTSLLVISLKSFTAFAGYASHVSIDGALTLTVAAAAAVGSLAGAFIAARVGAGRLRTTFAYVVLLMAGYVVWRQAGPVAAAAILAIAAVVIAGLRWSGMAGRANPVKGRSLPLAAGSAMGSGGTTNDETFGSP